MRALTASSAAAGLVDGRPVFCYAQDSSYAGGSLGEEHANTIVRVLELAGRGRAPVVGFVSSGGARMQEGVAALGGYGRIFRRTVQLSGRVPQISIVTGLSAGGGAYSPALTDWVVMTEESSMFLTGPGVVREALGEDVTSEQLGGTRVHERNGVCHFVARPMSMRHTWRVIYSATYPPTGGRRFPAPPHDPQTAGTRALSCHPRRVGCTTFATSFAAWPTAASCSRSPPVGRGTSSPALARIDGRTVGVIANQPRYLGGVLDAASSEKGARFVSKCNAFGIPLLVLVDTPGSCPAPGRSPPA